MSSNDYQNMLTIYGRKPVLEALQDPSLTVHKVHLADSNRNSDIIGQIERACASQAITINRIDRRQLSRISRNGKQDQGAAADLQLENYQTLDKFLASYAATEKDRFLVLDGITNPQNVGMILRSVAAAGITGAVVPDKGCASLGPLVIKASAGALFHCPILHCATVADAIDALCSAGVALYTLAADANNCITKTAFNEPSAFVLGNETSGVTGSVTQRAAGAVSIPMHNGVESLNVAVAAALVCYLT